jgi:hypothetical protein
MPTKERKALFLGKKKQKTFALAPASTDVSGLQLGRMPTGKSFLFFFSKKNILFS